MDAAAVMEVLELYEGMRQALGVPAAKEAISDEIRSRFGLNGSSELDLEQMEAEEQEVLAIIRTTREMRDWINAFESMVGKGMAPQAAFRHANDITAHWKDLASHRKPVTLLEVASTIRESHRQQEEARARIRNDLGLEPEPGRMVPEGDGAPPSGLSEQQRGGQERDQDQEQQARDLDVDRQHDHDQDDADDQNQSGEPPAEAATGSPGGSSDRSIDTHDVTSSTPVLTDPQPCRYGCGEDVWFAEHHQLHGVETFDLLPRPDGECLIDFSRGLYQVLPSTGSKKASRRRRPATIGDAWQGPFGYHVQRCFKAAEVLGFEQSDPRGVRS